MCQQRIRAGRFTLILLSISSPRHKLFRGYVCDFCLEMCEAWAEMEGVTLFPLEQFSLLTCTPHNLGRPTLVGVGGGGGLDDDISGAKRPNRSVARATAAP
jgi:hypothetical protein